MPPDNGSDSPRGAPPRTAAAGAAATCRRCFTPRDAQLAGGRGGSFTTPAAPRAVPQPGAAPSANGAAAAPNVTAAEAAECAAATAADVTECAAATKMPPSKRTTSHHLPGPAGPETEGPVSKAKPQSPPGADAPEGDAASKIAWSSAPSTPPGAPVTTAAAKLAAWAANAIARRRRDGQQRAVAPLAHPPRRA